MRTVMILMLFALTGCSNFKAHYLYSNRGEEYNQVGLIRESRIKLSAQCSVGNIESTNLSRVVTSGFDLFVPKTEYNLDDIGNGIRNEIARKMKESGICYKANIIYDKNSDFSITGELTNVRVKQYTPGVKYWYYKISADFAYKIKPKDNKYKTYFNTVSIQDLEVENIGMGTKSDGLSVIHELVNEIANRVVKDLVNVNFIKNMASGEHNDLFTEMMAIETRNQILDADQDRIESAIKRVNKANAKSNQLQQEYNQMISNFKANTQNILLANSGGSVARNGVPTTSSSNCNPYSCSNNQNVVYWKNKFGSFGGANQAPQYCAAAALSKCFLDNGLYAEAGCKSANGSPTSTTRGQLQDLVNTNLNNARSLGTQCW